MGKVKTVDFSETIAAFDLKIGRCRQLIEIMKVRGLSEKFVDTLSTTEQEQ